MAHEHAWRRDEQTGEYVHDVAVWVNAPVETCFRDWARFEEFPRIMRHITRVEKIGADRWHWEARLDGQHIEWDATMPEFRENEVIAWKSVEGVQNAGRIAFTPENSGTRIAVRLAFDPPFGVLGDLAAWTLVNQRLHDGIVEDLLHFKQRVESDQKRQAA